MPPAALYNRADLASDFYRFGGAQLGLGLMVILTIVLVAAFIAGMAYLINRMSSSAFADASALVSKVSSDIEQATQDEQRPCPYCQVAVSSKAELCPHCGAVLPIVSNIAEVVDPAIDPQAGILQASGNHTVISKVQVVQSNGGSSRTIVKRVVKY